MEQMFPLNTIRPYPLILLAIAGLVSIHPYQASSQQSKKPGSLTLIVADAEDKQPLLSYAASLTPGIAGSPILCNPDHSGLAYFKKKIGRAHV
jgi:hypothetical protein